MGFVNSQMLAGAAGGLGKGVSDMALLGMKSKADSESAEANFRKERSLKQMDIESNERIAGVKAPTIKTITDDTGAESTVQWNPSNRTWEPFQMGAATEPGQLTFDQAASMADNEYDSKASMFKSDQSQFGMTEGEWKNKRIQELMGGTGPAAPSAGGAPAGQTKESYYAAVLASNKGTEKDTPEFKAKVDAYWEKNYGEKVTGKKHAGQGGGIIGDAAAAGAPPAGAPPAVDPRAGNEIPAYPQPPGAYRSNIPSIEGEQRIPTPVTAAPEPAESKEGVTAITPEIEAKRADEKKALAARKRKMDKAQGRGVTVITPEIEAKREAEKKAIAERKKAGAERKKADKQKQRKRRAADAKAGGTPSVRAVNAIRANDMQAMARILNNPEDLARLTEHQRFTLEQAYFGTQGQ